VLPFFFTITLPWASPASLASLAADRACSPKVLTIRSVMDWFVFIFPINKKRERSLSLNLIYLSATVSDVNVKTLTMTGGKDMVNPFATR
jgi:hypothetical protein